MNQAQNYIDGQWIADSGTFDSINPSTGDSLGTVILSTRTHVDAAVRAARSALPRWQATDIAKRGDILARAAELLMKKYGERGASTPLKQLLVDEMGKRLAEADIEVMETSDMLTYFATTGVKYLQPQQIALDESLWSSKKSIIIYEAHGVVGIIKPWNYPLELPIWSIAPALLAGNTVVFKPSEHSSLVGLEIARLFQEAGLPPGVLNVITGDGKTGEILVGHEDVKMISFTGSVDVGRGIAIECARRHRRFSMELGGNDAAIVEPDVDFELATNGLVWGAFCNSGQVCVRAKRVFIHADVAEELISRIIKQTQNLRPGIDFGPIISDLHRQRIQAQIDDAVNKGGKILAGGRSIASMPGFYYAPTVLGNVNRSMQIMEDECFGPVLPIVIVSSTDEAIERANDSRYGLGASIWTRDLNRGRELAERLETGMVWINDINVAFPQAPWGGTKESGPGTDLSPLGIYEYVRVKHISVENSPNTTRDWWYPYS